MLRRELPEVLGSWWFCGKLAQNALEHMAWDDGGVESRSSLLCTFFALKYLYFVWS